MDEVKLRIALDCCMALAKERPRVLKIVNYLSELHTNPTWTPEELAELERRAIAGLLEATDADEVL